MIYFVQSGKKGPIKIGKSNDPHERIGSLQISSSEPLTLLGVMDGDIKEEKNIHTKFLNYRIKGEWFKPSNNLIEFIKSNTRKILSEKECEEGYCSIHGQLIGSATQVMLM